MQVPGVAKKCKKHISQPFSILQPSEIIPSLAMWHLPCLGHGDYEDVGRTSLANRMRHLLVGYLRGPFLPLATTWGVKKRELPAVLLKPNPNSTVWVSKNEGLIKVPRASCSNDLKFIISNNFDGFFKVLHFEPTLNQSRIFPLQQSLGTNQI